MAHSMDIRRRVVAALERGESAASIAHRLEIGERTVYEYRARHAAGQLEPDKTGPQGHVKLTDADLQLMREQVAARPGVTLLQLRDMLSVPVAESTVCRALQKMGLSLKKSR